METAKNQSKSKIPWNKGRIVGQSAKSYRFFHKGALNEWTVISCA